MPAKGLFGGMKGMDAFGKVCTASLVNALHGYS